MKSLWNGQYAMVCSIATATLVLAATVSQADSHPQTNVERTIRVPAFLLPESSLLDDKTRAALSRTRESLKDDFEAAAKTCPPAKSADRAAWAALRQCQAAAFYRTPSYKGILERYPASVMPQEIGGVYTEVFTPRGAIAPNNRDRVLINLHGGHFKFGSRVTSHLESIPIASIGKIKVISVDYRMAPEYAFPAASEDVVAVYRQLLKTYLPKNIGIYGCSAGGLLTAESIAWFQKMKLPLPGAIGMFGGAASYYQEGDSGAFSAAISAEPLEPSRVHPYFKGTDPRNPLAFPIYSAQIMAKFPPSLLISTTRDIGESSIVHTHSQLVKLGVDAELHIWEGLDHCFFSTMDLPQTDEVHRVIIRFFDRHLGME